MLYANAYYCNIFSFVSCLWLFFKTMMNLPKQSAVWHGPWQLSPSAYLCSFLQGIFWFSPPPVSSESLASPFQPCAFWFLSWFPSELQVKHRGDQRLNGQYWDVKVHEQILRVSVRLFLLMSRPHSV